MLKVLLLFLFISHSETPGTPSLKHVEGIKRGNITLKCGYQAEDISDIRYVSQGKSRHFSDIPACVNEEYKHESGRVCQTGACGIILKDLNFSDPGKYLLRFYYNNSHEELKFHLQVNDEISVKTGEDLHFDSLLINAERVERNSSGECKKVWTIGDKDDRVIVRERNLTIRNFTVSDTGTYIVKDSEGETLITVSVTESGPESGRESKRTDDDHKPKPLTIVLYVFGALALALVAQVVLVVLAEIIFAVHKTYQGQDRNTDYGNYQRVPTQDTVQYSRTSSDDTG